MKNSGKIAGMLLMLFIAGNISLRAQRGMRGMKPDSMMMMKHRQMPLMMQNPDSLKMGGMSHGMAPRQMNNMGRFMCPMCQMGQPSRGMRQMGPGMRRMAPGMGRPAMGQEARHFKGMGMQQAAPGMRIMENIPDLTDKQKKDIAELRQKQQDEMQKLREGMQVKIKDLMESHKSKVMNLLTDEQKKWVDENTPKPLNK